MKHYQGMGHTQHMQQLQHDSDRINAVLASEGVVVKKFMNLAQVPPQSSINEAGLQDAILVIVQDSNDERTAVLMDDLPYMHPRLDCQRDEGNHSFHIASIACFAGETISRLNFRLGFGYDEWNGD